MATDLVRHARQDLVRRLDGYEVERRTVPDDREAIADAIVELAEDAVLVLTTGGTGLGPRDVTPEATAEVLEGAAARCAALSQMGSRNVEIVQRREWDSNPRSGQARLRFSRPVQSTALPSLRLARILPALPARG